MHPVQSSLESLSWEHFSLQKVYLEQKKTSKLMFSSISQRSGGVRSSALDMFHVIIFVFDFSKKNIFSVNFSLKNFPTKKYIIFCCWNFRTSNVETESVAHILQIRSTHSGMVKASELENPLERRRVWGRETQPAVSDSHKNLRNERIGLSTFKSMSRKKIRSRRKKLQLLKVGRISGKSSFGDCVVAQGSQSLKTCS